MSLFHVNKREKQFKCVGFFFLTKDVQVMWRKYRSVQSPALPTVRHAITAQGFVQNLNPDSRVRHAM